MSLGSRALLDKKVALAYPAQSENKGQYRDTIAPDTIFIAHQALWCLGALVIVMDIQECQRRIINNEPFDFVFELSGYGSTASADTLLSAICVAHEIGYFPSFGLAHQIGSDKLVAKRFAALSGLLVPETIVTDKGLDPALEIVKKPICGGDSQNISHGSLSEIYKEDCDQFFYEQYIDGFDVTILCLRDPLKQKAELIAAFQNRDPSKSKITTNQVKKNDWFIFGESQRIRTSILHLLPDDLKLFVRRYLELIGSPQIARLDFRQQTDSEDFYFLEINTDPTLGANQLWYMPVRKWCEGTDLWDRFSLFDKCPVHPSAKVLAFLISENHV